MQSHWDDRRLGVHLSCRSLKEDRLVPPRVAGFFADENKSSEAKISTKRRETPRSTIHARC